MSPINKPIILQYTFISITILQYYKPTMVKQIKSFRLMGHTITMCEHYQGPFETEKRFIQHNKPQRSIKKQEKNHPLMKFPLKVTEAIKSFKLMGHTITVCENYQQELETERRFIQQNKPRRSIKKPERINLPLMKLPLIVIEAIKSARGTGLTFLMAKKLKDTDIDKYQNRLYISNKETLMGYVSEYEKQSIEKQGIEGGLNVGVIDPRGETYGMKLKWWESSNKYALIKDWGKMVRDNGLKKDDMVEIWCFRVDLKLHLVVNAVTRDVGSELRLFL